MPFSLYKNFVIQNIALHLDQISKLVPIALQCNQFYWKYQIVKDLDKGSKRL